MRPNPRRGRGALAAGGAAALAAIAIAGTGASPTRAAFPGANGLIVFSSNRPAADGTTDFEIYSMRADGTDLRQLTDNGSIPPSTEGGSGNGQSGAGNGQTTTGGQTTTSSQTTTSGQTTTSSQSGSETGGGSTPTPIDDTQPAVSPDGRQIAFVSNRPAADGKTDSEIYVMNADGSDVRQVTHNASGSGSGNDYEPAWSPDGSQIVYRHDDGRLADLYVVDVRTGVETRLVTPYDKGPAAYDGQPSWSPDGTEILFRKGMGSAADIWVYNLMAGDAADAAHMLIHDPSAPESAPSWSPNGRQIVYVRGDEGAGAGIWVANADGSDQHPIAQPQPDAAGLVYSNLAPRWSPDGRQIVFESTRDGTLSKPETESGSSGGGGMSGGKGEETEPPLSGNVELFVMNSDGAGQARLTSATSVDGPQDLSPDWQTIPLAPESVVPPTPTQTQLAAPVVEVPVTTSGKPGTVCLTRRTERIQVRVTSRDRSRLWAWWVSVNGRRVPASWHGSTLVATADMRGLKSARARVSVTVWLTGIVRLTAQRTYATCSGGRGGVSTFHLVRQTHPRVTMQTRSLGRGRFRLAGTVVPGHGGQQVMIQRKSATGWETVASTRARLGRGRIARWAVQLHLARTGYYRAYVEQDRAHLRSASAAVRLA